MIGALLHGHGAALYNAPEVDSMSMTIRAHFDGNVIVPDEPVDLPINEPLEVQLKSLAQEQKPSAREGVIADRLRRLAQASGRLTGPCIPADALRRENLYGEPA